jgi:rhomboid protease GluP
MTKSPEIRLRVTRDRKSAEEWELALIADGLSPSLRSTQDGFVLSVPEGEEKRALVGLSAYERENPRELQETDEPLEPTSWLPGVSVAASVLLFFSITWNSNSMLRWFERGAADADRMLLGELWRAVTALSLHANLPHALSNAVGIALFLSVLSGVLGAGLGSALVLLAGACGNLANALVHGSAHVSIGASSAVFGAVGMLGGLGLARGGRRKRAKHRAWMRIAAALALLAMLGTGGERVDVLAHLFGFLFGGVLGVLFAFVTSRPGRLVQWGCGSAALAVLIGCWTLAFTN